MGESPACLHHAVLKENEWSLSRPCAVCIMAASWSYITTIGQGVRH